MATSLTGLLDALSDEASRPGTTPVAADHALTRLGGVLQRLLADGLTTLGGSERERWVAETAQAACAYAAPSQSSNQHDRLTQLTAAIEETLPLFRDRLGCAHRSAIAIAVVDTITRLTAVADRGDLPGERRRALIVADAAATVVQRGAALDPPAAHAWTALDWAVPRHIPDPAEPPAERIVDAAAGLAYATGQNAAPLRVADYLAVCTATETLCRSAVPLTHRDDLTLVTSANRAGRSWAAARAVLNPFDDGTRRPQSSAPTAVRYAVQLDAALRDAAQQGRADRVASAGDDRSAGVDKAVRDAVQRLPQIGEHLLATLADWAAAGRVVAYACDLPPRDTRVRQHLAGFKPAGLVAGDHDDFAPARAALHAAGVLSVDLASKALTNPRPATTVPRLGVANRELHLDLTGRDINTAVRDTVRTMQIYGGPPRGARGPRR